LTPPCLTDYISIDNLQTFLDESSQQDGIALRLWSPNKAEKEESGWISDSWNNACQFHTLVRSYSAGKKACQQYFEQKAEEIIQNKEVEWHITMCPTSLYIFGWPIYDREGKILAILFGGLVRDSVDRNNSDEWRNVKESLKEDRAVLQELENEYCHAPSFTIEHREHVFSKWKLFCQFLSSHLSKGSSIELNDEYWVEWLISFHSCSTIARNLTKVKKVRELSLDLTIIDRSADYTQKNLYHLKITNKVQLTDIEKVNQKLSKKLIPVTQSNRICFSFDKKRMKNYGKSFYWKISRNIISGILIDHLNKKIAHYFFC